MHWSQCHQPATPFVAVVAMSMKLEVIRGTILLVVLLGFIVWGMARWYKRTSEDPGVLVGKWIISAIMLGILTACVLWLRRGMANDDYSVVVIPFIIVFLGIIFTVVWTPNIVTSLLKPLTGMMDGGDEPLDPQPLYSIARAKRKRGHYAEALTGVRTQLARFPTDLEGQLLAAEILAEDMNDLPGAEITIQRLVEQPGHAARNVAFALNTLADWHLKYAQDPEAARRALEQIQTRCPDTELALVAAQRIAHLTDKERLLQAHDRPRLALRKGVDNIGLLRDSSHIRPVETDPAKLAVECVAHLERHPLDGEVREQLAVLYADHFQRLDMAKDQLNQLIEQPNQPTKLVAHWLNLLADLQVRHGADFEAARVTLNRIVEKFPDHPVADLARNRLDLLRLEIKGQEKSQAVKLGSYEQNIGLKRGLPRQF